MEERTAQGAKKPRSTLSNSARVILGVALALGCFMLANTLYLLLNRFADMSGLSWFAVGETSLPQLFQWMVLSHTGAGLLAATIFIVFMLWHFPLIWRRRRWKSVVSGISLIIGILVLAGTGLFIMTSAASIEHAWIWWTHVVIAALAPAAFILHRLASISKPAPAGYRKFGYAVIAVLLVIVAGHMASHKGLQLTEEARIAQAKGLSDGPGGKNRDIAKFALEELGDVSHIPAAYVPPGSPFFPSAATTGTGDYLPSRIITRNDRGSAERLKEDLESYGFGVTEKIGAETCGRCHMDIVEQWSKSAHRFASFNNPFYEATINDMRENSTVPNERVLRHVAHYKDAAERIGMVKSKWCSGCHDPSLMLAGKMDKPIDRTTPEAQAGLTCLACHAIDQIHNTTGNGNYNIADEQEDPYIFPSATKGLTAYLHDTAIKAKPTVHKRQMMKPFFREGEFCATCHKVNLDVAVNNYRWLRGQNEYDNWHDSGVTLNAARTFYLPPKSRECQECHMPPEPAVLGDFSAKNGMVRSHRFLAVNTALPFIRGDTDTIERTEKFLRDEKLRVDIFAMRVEGRDQPVMALNNSLPPVVAGRAAEFDVVVRNLGVGHTFPGGTNDSNEGWLEFTVLDETGQEIFASGKVREDGHLDPHAHVYRVLMLDHDGNPVHRRNAQDIHVPVYVRLIGPGTADAAHYSIRLPEGFAGKEITVRARLLWRKFDRAYTEFAYNTNREAFKRFDKVPDLPITEIAANEIKLAVVPPDGDREIETLATPEEWIRFNDYGIGLFLQGDTRGAARAFEWVRKLQPEKVDGNRNLARVAIQDGNIPKAYEHLRECEKLKPGDAQSAWFWGVALQEDGRYEEAAAAYRRVLEQFPEDRATWTNLGRTFYLDSKYEEALDAFDKTLEIDAEDRVAHYHRMLCFQRLKRDDEAARAASAYEQYQIDESAQTLTQAHRLKHPADNLESLPLHVHELTPLVDLPIKSASTKNYTNETEGVE